MTKNKIAFIYALIDPISKEIRYIGKTTKPNKRLNEHLMPSSLKLKSHKNFWIKSLLKNNLKPIFKILTACYTLKVNILEMKYIAYYKKKFKLTNETLGGDGWPQGQKIKITEKRLKSYKTAVTKKVIARNLKTSQETTFNSVKECAIFLKSKPCTVSLCIKQEKGKKTVKGYHIRYFGTEYIEPIIYVPRKIVKRICLKTNEIKIYQSIHDVKLDGFSKKAVSDVCKNKQNRKQHKGYKWEFLNVKY